MTTPTEKVLAALAPKANLVNTATQTKAVQLAALSPSSNDPIQLGTLTVDNLARAKQALVPNSPQRPQSESAPSSYTEPEFKFYENTPAPVLPSANVTDYASINDYVKAGNMLKASDVSQFNLQKAQNNVAGMEALIAKRDAVDAKAWQTRDERGSFWGGTKEVAANVVEGVGRITAAVANANETGAEIDNLSIISDSTKALYKKEKDRNAYIASRNAERAANILDPSIPFNDLEDPNAPPALTAEESAILERNYEGKEITRRPKLATKRNRSTREVLQWVDDLRKEKADNTATIEPVYKGLARGDNARKAAKEAAETWDSTKQSREELLAQYEAGDTASEHLATAWTAAKVSAELLKGGTNVLLNNKRAVVDLVAQSSADLGLGVIASPLLAASVMAQGVDVFDKGMIEYRKNNDGADPTQDEMEEMAAWGLTWAAASYIGDTTLLRAWKKPKAMSSNMAADYTASITRKLADRGATVLKAPASALVEGATEGLQAVAEQKSSLSGKPLDGKDIFVNTTLGTMGGIGVSGPGAAFTALTGNTETAKKVNAQQSSDRAAVATETVMAVQSGDIDALINPESATYNPAQAANALRIRLKNPELTETEVTETTTQLNTLVADIDTQIKDLSGKINTVNKVTIRDKKAKLKAARQALVEQKKNQNKIIRDEGDPELSKEEKRATLKAQRAQYQASAKILATKGKELEESIRADEAFLAGKPLKEMNNLITTLGEVKTEQNNAGNRVTIEAIESADSIIDKEDSSSEQKAAAAQQSISFMLANEEAATPERAQKLLNSNITGFTVQQNEYLNSLLEAPTSEVGQDVKDGKKKGLTSYAQRIATAVRLNDQTSAVKEQKDIKSWLSGHRSKAKAVEQGNAAYLASGAQGQRTTQYVYKTAEGSNEWTTSATKPANAKALNTLTFEGRQKNIVKDVIEEVQAIKAMDRQIDAAIDLNFNADGTLATQPAPVSASAEQVAAATETQQEVPQESASTADAQVEPASVSVVDGQSTAATATQNETVTTPVEPVATEVVQAPVQEQPAPQDNEQVNDATAAEAVTQAQPESVQEQVAQESTEINEETFINNLIDELENPTEEVNEETGRVEILSSVMLEEDVNKPFKERNIVQQWIYQAKTNATDITKRAFIGQKNFLSLFAPAKDEVTAETRDKAANILATYTGNAELTAENKSLLFALAQYAKAWRGKVSGNMRDVDGVPNWRDKLRYFVDANGQLEGNVEDAITTAAFQYLAERINDSGYSTQEEVLSLIRVDDDSTNDALTSQAQTIYGEGWQLDKYTQNEIGNNVAQMLGLKARKNAPKDTLSTLATSMGNHAVALLLSEGILEQRQFTQAEYAAATGVPLSSLKDQEGIITAYRLRRDYTTGQRVAPLIDVPQTTEAGLPQLGDLTDKVKGATMMFAKLFGAESAKVFPTLAAKNNAQKQPKNSLQKTPRVLQERVNSSNSHAWQMKQDMVTLLEQFGDDFTKQMMGWVDIENTALHVTDAIKQRAVNESIERDLSQLTEWKELLELEDDGLETPFYLQAKIWVIQRAGFEQNAINPQSSKLARHFIGLSDYKVQIAFDGTDKDKHLIDMFKLSVAQNLGVKIENFKNADTIANLEKEMESAEAKAALAIVSLGLNSFTVSPQERQTLLNYIGSNEAAGLDALVQWAKYKEANGKPFEANIMGEVDGVANGPALLHAQLGANLLEFGEAFGFFTQDSVHENFADYKEEGQDFYEKAADKLEKLLQHYLLKPVDPNDDKAWAVKRNKDVITAMFSFMPDIIKNEDGQHQVTSEGRKLLKSPLTPLMFGAGADKAFAAMASDILDTYSKQITQAVKDQDKDALTDILTQVNVFIQPTQAIRGLNVNMSFEQALETALTTSQYDRATLNLLNAIRPSMSLLLEENFDEVVSVRNQMGSATEVAHAQYDLAYTLLRQQLIDTKVANGEIESTKGQNPLHDLTLEEEQAIRKQISSMEPTTHTRMSKQSGNVAAGLRMSKQKPRLAAATDLAYNVITNFKNKIPTNNSTTKPKNSMKGRAQKTVQLPPGAATTIGGIHAQDSGIASTVYGMMPALNIHDALGLSIANIIAGAKALNKETFDGLLEYSLPTEIYEGAARTNRSFEEFVDQHPEFSEEIQIAMDALLEKLLKRNKSLEDITGGEVANTVLAETEQAAKDAEIAKLQYLYTVRAVNQYNFEGASYAPTAEQKAAIEARLMVLGAPLVAKAPEGILNPSATQKKSPPSMPSDSVSGDQVGTPITPANEQLVRWFESIAPKDLNAGALIDQLKRVMKSGVEVSATEKAYSRLIPAINKKINRDIRVVYITTETEIPAGFENALGWFDANADNNQGVLYIKGASLVQSNVSPELAMHELLHATVKTRVFSAKQAAKLAKKANTVLSKSDRIVNEAVANLEKVRKKAKQYIADNDLKDFGNATQDVDELMSWGLTNERFQREVLANITYRNALPTETDNISGLQGFIKAIKDILFAGLNIKDSTKADNAVAIVLANTSIIFSQTENGGSQNTTTTKQKISKQESSDPVSFSHRRVFEALADKTGRGASLKHTARMRDALQSVVETVYGAYGIFQAEAERASPAHATDVFIQSLLNKTKPFTSKALGALRLTDQEAYTLQAVEQALQTSMETNSSLAQNELFDLYEEARNALSPDDFYDGDMDRAKEIYAFIFTAERRSSKESKSDFLSQFGALAVAYEPLSNALAALPVAQTTDSDVSMSLYEKAAALIARLMANLRRVITRTNRAETQDVRLITLARSLATQRKKEALRLQRGKTVTETAEDTIEALVNKGRNNLVKALASDKIKNSNAVVVQALGKVGEVVLENRGQEVIEVIKKVRNQLSEGKQGVFMSMLTDMQGRTENNQVLHTLLNLGNRHTQSRQAIKTQVANVARAAYTSLTDKQSRAVTEFLRTDAAMLFTNRTIAEMESLFAEDGIELNNAIKEMESQLTGTYRLWYLSAAKDLADHMVSSHTHENQAQNVHQIAMLAGFKNTVSAQDQAVAVEILNPLVSLYAIKYLAETKKETLRELFVQERTRPEVNENGVEYTLRQHQAMQEEALTTAFNNDPTLMRKGYVKEIYDQNIDLRIADAVTGEQLEKAGYVKVFDSKLGKDKDDTTSEDQYLYTAKGLGLVKVVSGIMSTTGKRSAGSLAGKDSLGTINVNETARITKRKEDKRNALLTRPENYTPQSDRETRLAPIFNPKGDITGWRQLMLQSTKEVIFNPDTRIDQVLGAMASNVFDKAGSEDINNQVVNAHHKQYEEDYVKNPKDYINFSASSSDPEIAEAFRLMPTATKREIKRVWGGNAMFIKNDVFNMTFGYRKYSITDGYKKRALGLSDAINSLLPWKPTEEDQRKISEQVIIGIANGLGVSQLRIRQTEDVWQEIVGVVKDILVIKSLVTFLGNLSSNVTLLAWTGVPINKIISGHVKGFINTVKYERDEKSLFALKSKVETGYFAGDMKREVEQSIVRLEDALERNPVHELVSAGLYQTIVEDVNSVEDPYSMKSQLMESIDRKTRLVPNAIKTGVKNVLMTHDTATYKVMHKATQYSDFIGRLILVEHLTTRRKNPLSRADAMGRAQDSFVNYDIPQHRALQYLNDTGLIWFTKYYIRIQKTIFNLFRENPARAFGLAMLEAYFPAIQSVLDSVITEKLANPFGAGAFELIDTWDDAITMQLLIDAIDGD